MRRFKFKEPILAEQWTGDLAPIARLLNNFGELKFGGGSLHIAVPGFDSVTHRSCMLSMGDWLIVLPNHDWEVRTSDGFNLFYRDIPIGEG